MNNKMNIIDRILLYIFFTISSRYYDYCKVGENKEGSTLFFTNIKSKNYVD